MNVNYKKIERLEILLSQDSFDDAQIILDSMNVVEKSVWRLRGLRGFVMPDDLRNISPLAYIDYIERRRAQVIADKTLSEEKLLLNLKVLNWKEKTVKKECSIIRQNITN